jgi:hypothetical protein
MSTLRVALQAIGLVLDGKTRQKINDKLEGKLSRLGFRIYALHGAG